MMILKRVLFVSLLAFAFCFQAGNTVCDAKGKSDFKVLIGKWIRPDGGYIIHVREIKPEGVVDAGYFNPKEIKVTQANVSKWKGLSKLFIKLEDEGYPGSTYTLYYYPEKDALAGFYYQAAMKKRFEVVFMRNVN
jgi:hypothetical protein